MKILVTGNSGFLGRYLQQELQRSHSVDTLSRNSSSTFSLDLSNKIPEFSTSYDIVIHAAGKAHSVPKDAEEEQAFFQTNEQGTKNLLQGLEKAPPQTLVLISTVAVYGREEGNLLKEDTPLEGTTPYAVSKIAAENAVLDFGRTHPTGVVILRLPLVVGFSAPGNLGAMIRAIRAGYYFRIGKGYAQRSMVYAQDIAQLIPRLLGRVGIYNLTDGYHPTYAELENKIAAYYKKSIRSVPLNLLKPIARIGDILSFFPLNTYRLQKIIATLTFSDQKARKELGWNPTPILNSDFLQKNGAP